MHQGTTLNAGEDRRVELLGQRLVIGEDHAAAWTAQGFVGCCRCNMGMREGRWVLARRHETRKVRHVHMQIGANAVRNLAHAAKSIWRGMAEPPAMIIFG